MNAHARHWTLRLLLALGLAVILFPATSLADTNGTVAGTVTNHTTNQPLAGATVTLSRFEGNPPAVTDTKTVTTGADGKYSFTGLDTSSGIVYVSSVNYKSVVYSTGMIQLQNSANQPQDIADFDTTTDASHVSLASRGIVLTGINSANGQVEVLDIFAFQLDGNLALVPGADGRTVHFSVPANASQVTPVGGFNFGTPSIEGATVYSTGPLQPGASTAQLSYDIPYVGGDVSLPLTADYPTQSLRVLVPTSGGEFNLAITASGGGLTDGGIVTINDQQYHLWSAQNVAAGAQLPLSVANLPRYDPPRNHLPKAPPIVLAIIALAAAAGLTAWVVSSRGLFRPRPVTLAPAVAVPLEQRRATLADELRGLEEEHELGKLDENFYAQSRRAILEELRRLSRQARGIGEDE